MMYAFFSKPIVTITSEPAEVFTDAPQKSAISDEVCYGQICRILEKADQYYHIVNDIGYDGFVLKEKLLPCSEAEARKALSKNRRVVIGTSVDVMNSPSVTGIRLITLFGGAILELLPLTKSEEQADGWSLVRLLDGRTGYIPTKFLDIIRFDESSVFSFDTTGSFCASISGINEQAEQFVVQQCIHTYWSNDEAAFREALCNVAKQYLGMQYRWGGRSGAGIDCSGLVSTAYRRCGLHIYRDAKIVEGWPMHEISLEQAKPGDALYFPGHIALYLGDGHYIHSTAKAGSNGVVLNSLNPEDTDYREDLVKSLTAVGTVF